VPIRLAKRTWPGVFSGRPPNGSGEYGMLVWSKRRELTTLRARGKLRKTADSR
jgi:hypothetical protein